jgi:signal peptidase I
MRRLAGIWLALLLLLSAPVGFGALTGGPGGFAYVVSSSMDPTLKAGDWFLLLPAHHPVPGDVITFRPQSLEAARVTHRVVAETPEGYLTRGDNNPNLDQEAGEPPVSPDRVIGRALTWRGRVVRIPGLQRLTAGMRDLLGSNLVWIAGLLFGAGLFLVLLDAVHPARRRRSRLRWRLGQIYGSLAVAILALLLISMLIGSRVQSVRYLASEDPGAPSATGPHDRVPVGAAGAVQLTVTNLGLLPVYHFSQGLGGAGILQAPELIPARGHATLDLQPPVRTAPGWYREYLRTFHYPPVLPRPAVAWLYRRSPFLAMGGVLAVISVLLWLLSHTLDLWTPLVQHRGSPAARMWRRIVRRSPPRRRAP